MDRNNEKCKMSGSMYGHTMSWESEFSDCSMDEFLDAFYGIMIGLTFSPKTILSSMKEFAEDRLGVYDKTFPSEEGDF